MVISVKNLDVRYKDKHAVKTVSFEVSKGEIFGMIGSNGAGKTSAIECIEGLRSNWSGTISVLGLDPRHDRKSLNKKIGVQLQETSYQDKVKVCELGKLFESFYDNPADFDALLKNFGLEEKKNSYVDKLSGGQRQKLSIILALMGKPQIVFLDELTTGLDPKARRDIWEKIKSLKETGVTVCMTTHFMDEAEYLCDRIAIMRQGEIVALDTLDNLVKNCGLAGKITFRSSAVLDVSEISSWDTVEKCDLANGKYCIVCDADVIFGKLSNYAAKQGILLADLNIEHPGLEDVFFKYTGETLSDESDESDESDGSGESDGKSGKSGKFGGKFAGRNRK